MPQNGAGETTGTPAATPSQAPGAPAAAPAAAPPKPAAPDYQALHAASAKEAAEWRAKAEAAAKERENDRLNALKTQKAEEKKREEMRRNPLRFFEESLGPDWYDTATKLKTGTVTPGAVSAQLTEAEQRMEQRFSEREKALEAKLARVEAAEEERVRRELSKDAASFVTSNTEKYPLLNRYKQADALGGFIEGHFKATGRQNPDGTWAPGEFWTHEQGAEALEKYWAGVRDMVLKSEHGRELQTEAPRLTILPDQRAPEPPKDDAERRKRIDDAFAAMAAKRLGRARPN